MKATSLRTCIRRAEDTCKFWLEPVSIVYNRGMTNSEPGDLERIIEEHATEFIQKWHEYFGK